MTVTIYGWMIPLFLSVLVVAATLAWPISKPTGAYDFGGAFEAAVHLAAGVIALLLVWLVYFAVT